MTTKFLNNKIFTFKILLSWRFPWKIAFWTIFLSAPLPTPPEKRKFYLYCRLAFSDYGLVNLWFACGSPFTKTTEIIQTRSWVLDSRNHGNHENDKNHENPGCKPRVPQTIGLEIPDIWGTQKGAWQWHSVCCFSQHLVILGPSNTAKQGKTQNDKSTLFYPPRPRKPTPPKFGGWRFTPQIWGVNLQKSLVLQCFLRVAP